MKKRIAAAFLTGILVIATFAACGGATSEESDTDGDPGTEEGDVVALDAIRKAGEDSGYNIYDEHQLVFLSEVKDGFSVEITADNQTTVYSFVECETEDAAVRNADDIDRAGYNIAIRDGRILTCYAVDKKGGSIEGILSSLMEGKPVDKELYDGSAPDPETEEPAEQEAQALLETTAAAPASTSSDQPEGGAITGTWASGTASGKYNTSSGKFEDVSGMGLIYTFREDGTFAQLIVYGDYVATTGKFSVKDGVVTLTDRVSVESSDSGQTWSAQETLPDASSHYSTGSDASGKYLLLGQEGAAPPLEASVNAMKFSFKQ